MSNALDVLIDAAKIVKAKNIHIVLVGDGTEKKKLQKRVENEKIYNITFLPSVSKRAIPKLVSYFDCCYMGGMESSLYRFGMCMNKLFDSMMAAKPIICAIDTPDSIIEDTQCGIMVEPGNAEKIAQAMLTLYHMPKEERVKMGCKGREKVIQHYNYSILAVEFARLFENRPNSSREFSWRK